MNISKEGIAVTKRFFEAIDMLKAQKQMRGLLTFTKAHNINYLMLDYGISADWILTGRGGMFK